MLQRTIGLDFGTHQTKVCVEEKDGAELSYEFFKFQNSYGKEEYTLPSVVMVDEEDHLHYGFVTTKDVGRVVKNFKQATFVKEIKGLCRTNAIYFSIWYLTYVLFLLEEKYEQEFTVQMGVPTDTEHLEKQQQLATRILMSAYRLVEEIYEGDKEKFLNTTMHELCEVTELVPYSKEEKENYGILVFPEAYACLMPLTTGQKIAQGMSLMVDIGGGTTDISFFTIGNTTNKEECYPHIFGFYSLSKGLNYLVDSEHYRQNRPNSSVRREAEILNSRRETYHQEIRMLCGKLWNRLMDEFGRQTDYPLYKVQDALKSRPIIYTGGGSSFPRLRSEYGGFSDVIHISGREWRQDAMVGMGEINRLELCPVLSTAYGLSISQTSDDIKCEPFHDVFKTIRTKQAPRPYQYSNAGQAYDRSDYGLSDID